MIDSGILVALIASLASVVTMFLQKCTFVYDHHPDGVYDLVIAFEREQSDNEETTHHHLHVK
jgi:hypothetical protein